MPPPTCIIVVGRLGPRLAVDNAIANAVKHGGATLAFNSPRSALRAGVVIAIDDNQRVPEGELSGVRAVLPRVHGIFIWGRIPGWRWWPNRPSCIGGTASLAKSLLGAARPCCAFLGPALRP